MSESTAARGSPPASAEIVVGVVLQEGRVLVQERKGDPRIGPVWELPGGKKSAHESREAAVAREVAEETGLAVEPGDLLVALSHAYPDRRVTLYAYVCRPICGHAPAGGEWVDLREYRSRPMPAANPAILDALAWWMHRG